MRLLLLLVTFSFTQTNERLARVIDKDGFTNVRSGQGLSFDVVDKVTPDDFFYCETSDNNDWFKVRLLTLYSGEQVTGYIHRSRIQIVEELGNEAQKQIILSVLNRQKLLADQFVESSRTYNSELKKWNSSTDSSEYRRAIGKLELYTDTKYSAILQLLPKTFCSTRDTVVIASFLATIWSDRGSANEMPSFALGECFVCDAKLLSEQVLQLESNEHRELVLEDIEWGLLNKFEVEENKESSNPVFLKLKKQLDLVRAQSNSR